MGIPVEWMAEIAIWLGWKQRNPKGKGTAVFMSAVVKDVSKQAWDALAEYQIDSDPAVYAFGETLARVDDGHMQILGPDALKHELNRCAAWLVPEDDGKWKQTSAPNSVVEDMMTARRRDVTAAQALNDASTRSIPPNSGFYPPRCPSCGPTVIRHGLQRRCNSLPRPKAISA